MENFPELETGFMLNGPVGALEVVATPVKNATSAPHTYVVICHPHPLFGGTMTNKVVTTLARACTDIGVAAVKFNFRGVGKSEGQFAEGIGEQADLLAVIDWVKKINPSATLWLAGFSFGAAVAAQVATQISPAQLISIAPPVERFQMAQLPPVTCPWLLVQGEEDDVVIPAEVYAWVATRNPPPRLIRIAQAGHFFHGKLMELRTALETELVSNVVN
jgi:alpha/beta superfamily hydrolase